MNHYPGPAILHCVFNIFNSIILPPVWSIRAKDTKWLADLIPPGARYILFEWLGVIVTARVCF